MLFAVLAFVRREVGRSFFNQTPHIVDNSVTTSEDTSTTVNVLANDTDADGDTLAVTSFTQPTHGTVVKNADGTLTYTPVANYNGTDTFTYTATDDLYPHFHGLLGIFDAGHKDTATVTVNVTAVNDAPDAVNDTIPGTVSEDSTSGVTYNVLANDTDVEGDTLSITGVTNAAPTYGTVSYSGNSVTYVPSPTNTTVQGLDDGETLTDTFTYDISDGHGGTDTATVSVTIAGANDAPVGVADDVGNVGEDSTTGVTYNVVANDTDVDGEALSVGSVTQGLHGTVTYAGGSVTYTPNATDPLVQGLDDTESLDDTFTYTVTDGTATTSPVTVTVHITGANDAPVGVADDAGSVGEDSTTGVTYDVIANDTDVDGETLSVASVTDGTYGTVTYTGGTVTYTPSPTDPLVQGLQTGDVLDDTFTYTVTDGTATTGPINVTVHISGANDAPVGVGDDAGNVSEDSLTGATVDVLANDTDVDGDALSVSPGSISQGVHGTVIDNGDGTLTYTPKATDTVVQGLQTGQTLDDTFAYTVTDGTATSGPITVTVHITGANDAPVFTMVDPGSPDSATGIIHGSVTATDVDGGPLVYSVPNTDTTYGSVSIDPQTGEFIYTPDTPVPSSSIPGTDFDSGTLAGWNVGSQTGQFVPTVEFPNGGDGVSVTTGSITFNSPSRPGDTPAVPARTWVYTPDGHAAMLSPDNTQTFSQASTALGLTAAQQQAIVTTSTSTQGGPTDAAWISKTVHLEADTTYTMAWNYVGTDYQPYNDGSITTLVYQGAGPAPTVYVNGYEENYAILGYTNTGTGDYSTGSYGSTGWQTSTYRVTEKGDYTLGFAVFNIGDTAYDPILLVDSEGGSTLRDGQSYDPVPPNSPTAPHTVDDTFAVHVSDGNGGTDDVNVTVQVTVVGAPQAPIV